MGRSGPTIGSAQAPLVSSAGKDHVIFSKKLLIIIVAVIAVTAFIFFSVEQSRIASNVAASRVAIAQNNEIGRSNQALEQARKQLQSEEDELVNMYAKWLDEDSEAVAMNEEEIKKLKDQFRLVQQKLSDHSDSLDAKRVSLEEKEKRLAKYQFMIQQKQGFIDQLAEILSKLNKTVPPGLKLDEAAPDDWIWDDEIEGDDDYYDSYYTTDDDWMSYEEWY